MYYAVFLRGVCVCVYVCMYVCEGPRGIVTRCVIDLVTHIQPHEVPHVNPPHPLPSGPQTLSCHMANVTSMGHACHTCVPTHLGLAEHVCSGGVEPVSSGSVGSSGSGSHHLGPPFLTSPV